MGLVKGNGGDGAGWQGRVRVGVGVKASCMCSLPSGGFVCPVCGWQQVTSPLWNSVSGVHGNLS